MRTRKLGRIGVALGSGSARGWAHIGVLRVLEEAGLQPTVVAGCSVGAVVGAAYAAGTLDGFEQWVRALDQQKVRQLLDFSGRGGLIRAVRVIAEMAGHLAEATIEGLQLDYVAVATDLYAGREVWLREGPLADCLRASSALPGLIAPVRINDRWLVDGGLVDPVPVAPCRALGADTVIAVDLNATLLDRSRPKDEAAKRRHDEAGEDRGGRIPWAEYLPANVADFTADLRERLLGGRSIAGEASPGLYEVVVQSINIMQARVTRSRMAGDPPDLLVTPWLSDFSVLDFHRADEAIEAGRQAALRALAAAPHLTRAT